MHMNHRRIGSYDLTMQTKSQDNLILGVLVAYSHFPGMIGCIKGPGILVT